MKPQKPKSKNTRVLSKWSGYYFDDINCIYCQNWQGKKKGCSQAECQYKNEKLDALTNGRIKRKRGSLKWDS